MKQVVLFFLRVYKYVVSPALVVLFGHACKHKKTCSEYAIDVIQEKGVAAGGRLAVRRFLSCNSWGISLK